MSTNYLKYYGEEPITSQKTETTKFVVMTSKQIAEAILMRLKLNQAQGNK